MSFSANPRLFVVSAPSGTGKTTIVRRLVAEAPGASLAVSHTTRPPRAQERHARDYFFVGHGEFDEILRGDGFLEHASVFGNRYGTSRREVEQKLASGRKVILEIDWQGAGQIRASMPEAESVFLLPPTRAELRQRLEGRKSDPPEVLERRLSEARGDVAKWRDFHYALINDDLDRTCRRMLLILEGRGTQYSVADARHRERIEQRIASGGW